MRVGLILYGSLDILSGGYLYDRKLVEYLRRQGDSVEIIPLPVGSYTKALLHNFSRAIRERLAGLQVDVLLQDELNHPSLFWLNDWLRSRVNFPVISIVHHLRNSEHHPGWLMPVYRAVERRYLKSADGFIFNSHSSQRSVATLAPNNLPFFIATPGGDALPEADAYENNAHSHSINHYNGDPHLAILFVGHLIERKGLHQLLKGLSAIKTLPWLLRVVGRSDLDPAYTQRCQEIVAQSGLSGKVVFLGVLSDADLVAMYQTSQILAVPSSYEGFGIVYLEAMRWGVIPIGSTAGGAAEIIENGINGWLVAPGDTNQLTDIISLACQNPANLDTMRQAARQRYHQFPTWDQTTEKIRQFLLELI